MPQLLKLRKDVQAHARAEERVMSLVVV
jgi:hypothetical protein